MSTKRTKPIYGNCKVYHPDGTLMFLCLEKRANWYLERNLAEIVDTNPLTIKLNFVPKGTGNYDEFYLSVKSNACVVCGEKKIEDLTKHHVIPVEYRKHFPEEKKSRSSHDIVIMCTKHHYEYENNFAHKFKRKIEEELGLIRSHIIRDRSRTGKAYSYAGILLDLERVKKIPSARIEFFMKEMKEMFGTDDPYEVSKMNIIKKMEKEEDEIGCQVVEKLTDIDEFAKKWRQHFIESMNPQFMPDKWKIDYKIK